MTLYSPERVGDITNHRRSCISTCEVQSEINVENRIQHRIHFNHCTRCYFFYYLFCDLHGKNVLFNLAFCRGMGLLVLSLLDSVCLSALVLLSFVLFVSQGFLDLFCWNSQRVVCKTFHSYVQCIISLFYFYLSNLRLPSSSYSSSLRRERMFLINIKVTNFNRDYFSDLFLNYLFQQISDAQFSLEMTLARLEKELFKGMK